MILLLHIAAALIVAFAVVVAGARLAWPLCTILVLVILEMIAVAVSTESRDVAISVAILAVAVPWAVVAGFIYLTRRLRHRRIIAGAVPVIYLLSFGTSVVIGLNSGVLRP